MNGHDAAPSLFNSTPSDNTTKTRRYAGMAGVVAIHKRLTEVLTKGEDGLVAYAEGVSDTTVATELEQSVNSVANVRQQMFGDLRRWRAPKPAGVDTLPVDLGPRLNALEQTMDALLHHLSLQHLPKRV